MKYSIGEFASLLGVTADTLRLYEKHEIVRPLKDRSNNYRFFGDLDARDLLMSRWYRSMHIPLPEVKELLSGNCRGRVMDKITEAEAQLEEEIRQKTLLLERISGIARDLGRLDDSLYSCSVIRLPGMYRLRQTQGDRLVQKDSLKSIAPIWMELLPYVFYSFRMETGSLAGEKRGPEYSWGLTLLEEDIPKLGIEIRDGEDVEYWPPEECISSVILSPHEKYLEPEAYRFMLDYAAEHGLSASGDVRGSILLTERFEEGWRTYLKIHIPVHALSEQD
ncbi:MerR family transcriptional regulator [Paenibacillus sp. HN-1]|uniref:MerR family transcriptional regulator n=1 Tax=Paenibacillus TaxID=44249 RepID=UPI001CA9CAB9|nr:MULTISPECIES: MerR family transcriptional regulator [Paenibacillus]MBY9077880.1 MerR family transcriptional regulator [Paenibacillus sp. CGMCC 1.18879]MBY9088164.1 MerR family transcriptional regulator [Paenibacillus sinensis]